MGFGDMHSQHVYNLVLGLFSFSGVIKGRGIWQLWSHPYDGVPENVEGGDLVEKRHSILGISRSMGMESMMLTEKCICDDLGNHFVRTFCHRNRSKACVVFGLHALEDLLRLQRITCSRSS